MSGLLHSTDRASTMLGSGLSFAGARSQQDATDRYLASITVGHAGKCAEQSTLLIVNFDNSGSVTGANDPVGRRHDEAYVAISRVGTRCRCGEDLVASLTFDSPNESDLKPTPITKPHLSEVRKRLFVPPGGGSSNLGSSLGMAFRLASQYPDHHAILVNFSDYQLFDPSPAAVMSKLGEFPGTVHAIVLGVPAPLQLIDSETVIVTEVNHASPAGTVARAVFMAMTEIRPGAKPIPPVQEVADDAEAA